MGTVKTIGMSVVLIEVVHPYSEQISFFGDVNSQWLHTALLVKKDNVVIGGLCVYDNTYVSYKREPVLLIGNVHCADDKEAFDALIDKAIEIAADLGVKYLIGPVNGSTLDAYRFAVMSEAERFTGDIAQPLYYNDLFVNNGFDVMHSYYSSLAVVQNSFDIDTASLTKQGVTIRSIDKDRFEEELHALYPMCSTAFEQNELFSPIDEQTFVSKYVAFKDYINPAFVQIAEDAEGVVGLFFCYKGVADGQPAVIIKTIARHPQRTYKGMVEALAGTVYNNALREGVTQVVHAFMHEDNKSLQWSARYGGEKINQYVVYIKQLHV